MQAKRQIPRICLPFRSGENRKKKKENGEKEYETVSWHGRPAAGDDHLGRRLCGQRHGAGDPDPLPDHGGALPDCGAADDLPRQTKEEAKCGLWLGAALFGGFALQIIGLQYTTPSKNAFLTATNVVLVPFIALVFYRKKIAARSLVGAVMAVIGAGVLSLQSDFSLGLGDGLTLLCAVCFALQIFLTGEYVDRIRPTVLNFLQMTTACGLSILGMVLAGDFAFHASTRSILGVLYLGVVSTSVSYLLQTASQKYVDETKSAIVLSLEAVFGTVFSVILLHETITTRMVIGSALILSAVLVSQLPSRKERQKAAA